MEELVLKHGLIPHETHKYPSKVLSLTYFSMTDSFVLLLQGGMVVYMYGIDIIIRNVYM